MKNIAFIPIIEAERSIFDDSKYDQRSFQGSSSSMSLQSQSIAESSVEELSMIEVVQHKENMEQRKLAGGELAKTE